MTVGFQEGQAPISASLSGDRDRGSDDPQRFAPDLVRELLRRLLFGDPAKPHDLLLKRLKIRIVEELATRHVQSLSGGVVDRDSAARVRVDVKTDARISLEKRALR